ncbi:MAG TPA: PAS domain-containing protein, partial [Ilumatobacteraceae bacterium]
MATSAWRAKDGFEAAFHAVAGAMPHLVWTLSNDGSTEWLSEHASAFAAPLISSVWDWIALVHPDDVVDASVAWNHALANRTPFDGEVRLRLVDGMYRWHSIHAEPTADASDHFVRWIATAIDIDGARMASDSMRFQSDLLAAAGQAIVAVALDRTVIYWNRAAEVVYGWSADEAIGRLSTELIRREEGPEVLESMVAAMLEGESWTGEYNVTTRDGRSITVFVTNTPMFDAAGDLVAVIGSSIDVTERK